MTGFAWQDIRPTIPQPHRAEAAVEVYRRAEVYLWHTPADLQHPYRVEVRLLDDGRLVERWTRGHSRHSGGYNRAHDGYNDGRDRAGKWLTGAPLELIRPERGWKIEKGEAPQ